MQKATDGGYTCQIVNSLGQPIYLYSRYKPLETAQKNIGKIKFNEYKNYLVLGLGLGYELNELYKRVKDNFEQIIVIEKEPELFNMYLYSGDQREVLADSRVTFVIGGMEILALPKESLFVVENPNLVAVDPGYYKNVIRSIDFAIKREMARKVVVFEHITFAGDVSQALTQLGYAVEKISISPDLDDMAKRIRSIAPLFIFSINFNRHLLRIAEYLQIPYVSWTVDTPSLDLFNHHNKSPWALLFIYEKEVVEQLRKDGFNNVFYLPAAANVFRNDLINILEQDTERFQCDLSFIGTTGLDNEFRKFYQGRLEPKLAEELEKICATQLENPNEYLIPRTFQHHELDITQLAYRQSGIRLGGENYISDKLRFAYVLAKEACARWRLGVIEQILIKYKIHIYGDKGWEQYLKQPNLVFQGFAEHFTEVPKIYKLSKINLNLTRIYVQSGLPMRVFDTLAAGGFLLTNHKKDLEDLFEPGKDLIIFSDEKEMLEAIEYYLHRKEEREAIAVRGYETVKTKHTFFQRIQEVLYILRKRDFTGRVGD
ncbi:MAG: glycosyltransferase [Carboxydocellales bacterium]